MARDGWGKSSSPQREVGKQMGRLMLHRQVLKDFGRLPSRVQKGVSELIEEFHRDHTSPRIHLHGLPDMMVDPKVRGANLPDGFRAIVIAPERGDTFLLMHVAKHDDAYAWAKNKRFEVHQGTGVFQVFDVEQATAAVSEPPQGPAAVADYPLNRLTDEELFHAGVPRLLVPSVRAVSSDAMFDALEEYLPRDCREVLRGVAAGMTLDEALEATLGQDEPVVTPTSPGDFTRINEAPNFDLVIVEGEEHLREILDASLEEWRLFLHPYQRKLVEWETSGPVSINGAAGTGKTVVLMHRAVNLARKLTPDAKLRVLVTTFSTNLSPTIRKLMQQLDPVAAERIEVTNLYALARTICLRSEWRGRIADEEDLKQIWDDVWLNQSLGESALSHAELQKEYAMVVDANGIEDEDSYLTTVRSGRPRLSRAERKQVWPFLLAFQRGLKKRNLLTSEGAVHQARLAVEQGRFTRYAHVLVDEIQDFGIEALRLIRALSPIDEGGRDPLCVVGDGHQRIRAAKVPLSRAGIEVRGRSRRLRINYRTTEQIRLWAHGTLTGIEIDDLNGDSATIVGDRSVIRGPAPTVVPCADARKEAQVITDWVRSLLERQGLQPHEVCVTPYRPEVVSALAAAGIPRHELKPREEDPGPEDRSVRLGSMERVKGLEFRAVAMACADPDDALNRAEVEPRERCERYVAATRAREHLLVTVAGD